MLALFFFPHLTIPCFCNDGTVKTLGRKLSPKHEFQHEIIKALPKK